VHDLRFLQDKINEELSSFCNGIDAEPKNLYEAVSYTISLGGKRMRPALLLMACEMFEGKVDQAIKPAPS